MWITGYGMDLYRTLKLVCYFSILILERENIILIWCFNSLLSTAVGCMAEFLVKSIRNRTD